MKLRSCENCVHKNSCRDYEKYGKPIPITFARTCSGYLRAQTEEEWIEENAGVGKEL